jgi:hypothetical protein
MNQQQRAVIQKVLEADEYHAWLHPTVWRPIIENLRQLLEQPEPAQEPFGTYMGHRMTPAGTKEFWGFADASIPVGAKLYTTPPAAQPAPVQEPVSGYIKKIEDLIQERDDARSSRDFYKRRADALQKWQSKMREPERTIVCDILANGHTLEPAGDRYTTPPAQPAVPLTDEQIWEAIRPLCNTDQVCSALVDTSMDEYRAIEAAHGITAAPEKN